MIKSWITSKLLIASFTAGLLLVIGIWLWPALTTASRTNDQITIEFDQALATKNLEQASRLADQYQRQSNSKDHRLPMIQARLELANGQDSEALKKLESIPDQSPFASTARQLTGQLYLRANRLVPAEKAYLDAIRLDPKIVQPRRELIYIYAIQLRRRELRNIFLELSTISPMTFQNVFHWCLTRGNDWEPDEIVADMTKFLAADPQDKWSRIALARSLKRLVKLDEAEKALEPLAANDSDAIAIKAQIAMDRNDPEKARELLSKGPEDHFDLAVMRAQMALAEGDYNDSIRYFKTALKVDPDNRDAVVGLARALAGQGNKLEAKAWQEKATKLDKLASLIQEAAKPEAAGDSSLPRRLADGCESVGHFAEAKAWWGLIAARDPLNQEAQQALYRLGKSGAPAP
jgi:tetratricopeptide (TPR) repeat protein